jgi:hypothetical protein
LTQLAEDSPSVGAAHLALNNTLSSIVAAALVMHHRQSQGATMAFAGESEPDTESDDQVLQNSLIKRQFRDILSFGIIYGPLTVPAYSVIARLFSRHATLIGVMSSAEYHCQRIALKFIDAYREQV